MKISNEEYAQLVKARSPNSPLWKDMLRAFAAGGLICCVGQALTALFGSLGLGKEDASAAVSVTMVFLGVALTALGVYDRIAKFAGAGTLVPITGFANSVSSPAMEFKAEGYIAGLAAKMFVIAGPVIVYGVTASIVYGMILVLFR